MRISLFLVASLVLGVGLAATGCKKTEAVVDAAVIDAGSADAGGAADASASRSAISKLPMDAVIVIVDGISHTRADLEHALAQRAAMAGMPADQVAGPMRDAFEKGAYDKLIERTVLQAEAKKRGLWPTPEDVKKERERLIATIPAGKTLKDVLEFMHTTEADFDRDLVGDVAIGRLIEQVKAGAKRPDDAALQKIYQENADAFATKEMATASHILIKLEDGAPQADVDAATARIKAIRAEVAGKDAATFTRVATEKSEDPTAKSNGGSLGTFGRGDMVPAFEEVAFKMKSGQISDVVRTPFGLHILRSEGVTPAQKKTFAEVKSMIAEREANKAVMDVMDGLIADLKKQAKIERKVEPVASPLDDGSGGGMMPAMPPPGEVPPNPHGG